MTGYMSDVLAGGLAMPPTQRNQFMENISRDVHNAWHTSQFSDQPQAPSTVAVGRARAASMGIPVEVVR